MSAIWHSKQQHCGSNTLRVKVSSCGCVLSHGGPSSRFDLCFLFPHRIHITFVLNFSRRLRFIWFFTSDYFSYMYFIDNMARFSSFTQFLLLSFAAFLLAADSKRIKGKFVSDGGGLTKLFHSFLKFIWMHECTFYFVFFMHGLLWWKDTLTSSLYSVTSHVTVKNEWSQSRIRKKSSNIIMTILLCLF